MTVMLPGQPVSRWAYMVRALIAGLLILAFSVWMVARSTGILSSDPKVYAEIPVSAGLIQTGAPVRYHGVKVGEITSIDAGSDSSRIGLTIDESALDLIPATVVIRVLPRTFFGDIYLQLVQRPGAPVQQGNSLKPGTDLAVDDGPDAVNLYDIFTKLSDLIAEVEPDQVNVALAAVNRAVGGRGQELGVMIDDWWAASQELESTVHRFLEATPEFRRVAESLRRATPDVIDTLNSVTNISRGIVEHDDELAAFFTSALGFVSATGEFVAAERKNLITVLDATGKILATVADHPSGVSRSITEAGKFGVAGTIFLTPGGFSTAVATFSEPMPYTAADCPTYGDLRGAQCFGAGSAAGRGTVRAPGEGNSTVLQRKPRNAPAAYRGPEVIDGKAEAPALGLIQKSVAPASASSTPNAATVLMLGPMVRGNQVELP